MAVHTSSIGELGPVEVSPASLTTALYQDVLFPQSLVKRFDSASPELVRRDTMTGMVASTKETENKDGYLKNNPAFDWQPVKCLEQWSNIVISALAKKQNKKKARCAVLPLQPVHLSDQADVSYNEQGAAVVQPTDNKRTHKMSSGYFYFASLHMISCFL